MYSEGDGTGLVTGRTDSGGGRVEDGVLMALPTVYSEAWEAHVPCPSNILGHSSRILSLIPGCSPCPGLLGRALCNSHVLLSPSPLYPATRPLQCSNPRGLLTGAQATPGVCHLDNKDGSSDSSCQGPTMCQALMPGCPMKMGIPGPRTCGSPSGSGQSGSNPPG